MPSNLNLQNVKVKDSFQRLLQVSTADTVSILDGYGDPRSLKVQGSLYVTANTISNGIYGITISGDTLYSGNTDVSTLFVPISLSGGVSTYIQNGLNTYTGGTAFLPTINISGGTFDGEVFINNDFTVSGNSSFDRIFSGGTNLYDIFATIPLVNTKFDKSGGTINGNIIVSGDTILQNLSATTIFSAGTNLYDIFQPIGFSGETFIQNGLNTFTGGTANRPTINITGGTFNGSLLVNNTLTVTGITSLQSVTGTTIFSGNNDLNTIFASTSVTNNLQTQINNKANLSGATFTGFVLINNNLTVTGDTNLQTLSATTFVSAGTNLNTYFSNLQTNINNVQIDVNTKANKSGDTFTGNVNINANLIVTGNTSTQGLTATTLSAVTINVGNILSANTNLNTFFGNLQTQINNKANLSGATFTGAITINNTLTVTGNTSVQRITGTTIFSGNSDLSTLFVPISLSGGTSTYIQNGINTFTAGTASLPTVNITGLTVNNLSVTGTNTVNIVNLSGGTISGGTFYSGNSDFNTIIKNSHLATKSNIILGGSFTGNPKVANIIFTTPYTSTAFTISITGTIARSWSYENKTASGFTINSNANGAFTTEVSWSTIFIGEL